MAYRLRALEPMARFLVVDDDHAAVRGLTTLLSLDGHHVSPFTSGAEAVGALARESFDAVVTDLEMPETDGHAVLRAARECSPQACLVVASARGSERHHELTAAGACIVADKPFDYDAIANAIRECRQRGGPASRGDCWLRAQAPTFPLRRKV